MTQLDTLSVGITADTSAFRRELGEADKLAGSFGKAITGSLVGAASKGKTLGDVFGKLATQLGSMALKSAFKGGFNVSSSASNEDDDGESITPFAKGGVVSQPTYFPMQGATGLMGEAGQEAIMPLSRTSDGRLGVAMEGGGSQSPIVFNVTATDAASFKRSEGEISAMLARSVGRGQRSL